MKLNKLFLFLLSAVLLAGFASCSSDDDDSIVGTWTYSKTEVNVSTNNTIATRVIEEDIANDIDENDISIMTFNGDGTCFLKEESEEESGTVTPGTPGRYTYENGILTTTMKDENGEDEETESITISLSKNSFSAHIDDTDYYKGELKYLLADDAEGKDVDPKTVTVSSVIKKIIYTR